MQECGPRIAMKKKARRRELNRGEKFDISVRLAISDFLPLSCPLCIRVISDFHTLCSMFSSFRRFVVLSVSSRIVNSTRSRKLCITPVFFSVFFSSFIADGANQRATTLPIPHGSQGIYPSLPGSRLRVFIAMQVQQSYTSSTNG